MSRRKLSDAIKEQVRSRANYLYEYCHTSEKWQYVRFTVDHVIPPTLSGTDDIQNLAPACFHCNRRKSNKISAVDLESGQEIALFNPRNEVWQNHSDPIQSGESALP